MATDSCRTQIVPVHSGLETAGNRFLDVPGGNTQLQNTTDISTAPVSVPPIGGFQQGGSNLTGSRQFAKKGRHTQNSSASAKSGLLLKSYEEEQKIFTDARVETVTKLYLNRERQAGLAHFNLMTTRWPSTFETKLFTERFLQSKTADIKTLQPQFDDDEVASTSTYTQKSLIQSVQEDTATCVEMELDLSHKKHKSIDLSRLGLYKDLRILNLKHSELTIVPSEIGECHELQKLDLSFNKISKIPESLYALEQLTELNMRSNALTSVPDEIGKLKSMKTLNLSSNKIEKIPASLCALEKLTELNMGSNALTSIPDEIGKLKSMETLDLSFNKIDKIPDSLCALEKLTELYMNDNALTSVPDEIGKLKSMKTLNLSSNKIEKIPASLCTLEQLTELDMKYNALTAIPDEISKLKSMNILNLDNNKMEKIPDSLT
uniref:Leucine-rich repeat and death domain-containing protein 1-like n=1 Tax=Saccoglossus kowalevskii TaxID=10224 RepID=A0ABM0M0N8_SACKO|nr:PREDICTED: leucine-rich repeat and death domain-containing protein 1-like [Saccoglossus kowalevskii]